MPIVLFSEEIENWFDWQRDWYRLEIARRLCPVAHPRLKTVGTEFQARYEKFNESKISNVEWNARCLKMKTRSNGTSGASVKYIERHARARLAIEVDGNL